MFKRFYQSLTACLIYVVCIVSSFASDIHVIQVSGPIGPASYSYLEQQLDVARIQGADLVVMLLNTPGGLVTSMRGMAEKILSSDVPVAVYVAPSGAQATSAGAYLVFASHVAAMAPGTNIGAATPIPLAGESGNMPQDPDNKDTVKLAPVAQIKVLEDLSALMRSLAELRGRNAKMGIAMVRQGKSYTASEALMGGVIDYMSPTLDELIKTLDQHPVTVHGKTKYLHTKDARIHFKNPDWRNQILSILTDPNVTYILMILGMYGVLLEFYNPGSFYPGVIGGICLILAGYSLHLLPVNVAGLALIVLGLVFLLFEALTPSYGVFGVGGLVAFVFGSIFLIDTNTVFFQVHPLLITSVTLLNLAFFLLFIRMIVQAIRAPSITGGSGLVGKSCAPVDDFLHDGSVICEGIIYRANAIAPVKKGDKLIVYEVLGNKLFVRPDETSSTKQ